MSMSMASNGADPQIDSAVSALRSIFDHPDDARARTLAGFAHLRERYAPAVVGAEIERRLINLGVL